MAMQVAGPVRGTYNAEGRFFAVAGNTLFQITAAGVSVPLGTVPGVGRVSFSHNQITNGNEILVNNGTSGYIYNTVTQVFQRITDTSYPGGLRAVFINNRFVQIEPARRYLFNSALADGLSYTALDRFTSETSPDLAMSIESIGNQLAVFSSTTTEWFEDTGANPQPFRSTDIVADKGAAGPFSTAKMDNQLFMLADDGVFYRYQGYNPVRISTKPIEQAIRNKNWFNVFTTVWEDSGYAVCYWTFPDGHTWGYDASSGKWHRRESYGFNRWRLNSLTYWQNAWYGGDFQNGRLWQLDWDYLMEGDQEFESIRAAGVISDNQNRVIHERLEVIMDTGMVETVPIDFVDQPEGPSVTGSAPDGDTGVAYSYAYSPVAGDAPIARTIILSGTILPGLTWNQATATLSGTATESGIMELTLRTIDTNGLYADLTDTIWMIGEVVWDSDTMTGGDALIIDDGIGFQGQSSAQGFVSANVTLNNGDWYWETTTGWYRQSDAFINEYGSGGIIQGSTNYYGLVIDRIGSTDDGGAVSSDPALFDTQVLYVGWFPPAATLRSERIRHRLTFDGGEATWQVAIGAGAWTEIMAGKDGPFTPYAMSRGTTNEISPSPEEIAKTVYIYSRPDQFDYDVPDGALPLQLAAPAA
jgi:hypothetical protein